MTRRLAIGLALGITAAMVIASVLAWASLPADATIPVHWQDNLTPDRFVSKDYGLVLMPLISVFTFGLLSMLSTIDSELLEAVHFRQAAHWGAVAVAAGLATAHGYAILQALGRGSSGSLVLAAAVLSALGAVVASTRHHLLLRLHAVALSHDGFVWSSSHLVVGGLLVAAGMAIFVAGLLGVLELGGTALALVLAGGALTAGAHTYLVYRSAIRDLG